ncbi:hypothetical protein V6Z12_A02G129600 [Gossypium hirsutum]
MPGYSKDHSDFSMSRLKKKLISGNRLIQDFSNFHERN